MEENFRRKYLIQRVTLEEAYWIYDKSGLGLYYHNGLGYVVDDND